MGLSTSLSHLPSIALSVCLVALLVKIVCPSTRRGGVWSGRGTWLLSQMGKTPIPHQMGQTPKRRQLISQWERHETCQEKSPRVPCVLPGSSEWRVIGQLTLIHSRKSWINLKLNSSVVVKHYLYNVSYLKVELQEELIIVICEYDQELTSLVVVKHWGERLTWWGVCFRNMQWSLCRWSIMQLFSTAEDPWNTWQYV